MLVGQDDLIQVGRDGYVIVRKVLEPGAITLHRLRQEWKYLA